MSSIKHAIISAAGMGTRLGLNAPKCLLQFNGISIIQHQLDLLKDIEDVRIVVGFMEESVVKTVKVFEAMLFCMNFFIKQLKQLQYILGTKD